ncbi:hypothetical protein ACRALDRAFT_211195 [Sodiomyces alcalophilus JCM 7366]|uniref:uncharacterized protein n=1 Tax=Sodiomyces alcalophilus JCM 7366 TaxID=591952 RepID=UPI0039B366AF
MVTVPSVLLPYPRRHDLSLVDASQPTLYPNHSALYCPPDPSPFDPKTASHCDLSLWRRNWGPVGPRLGFLHSLSQEQHRRTHTTDVTLTLESEGQTLSEAHQFGNRAPSTGKWETLCLGELAPSNTRHIMYELSQRETEKTFRLRYELSRVKGEIREIRAEFSRQVDFIQTMRLLEEMGLWVRRSKTSSSRSYAATPPSFSRPFLQHTDFSPPLLSGASFQTPPILHHRHYIPTSPYQHGTSLSSPFAHSSSPFELATNHVSPSPLMSNRETLHPFPGQQAPHGSSLLNTSGEALLGTQQRMSHYDSVRAVSSSPLHMGAPHGSRPEGLHSLNGLTGGHLPRTHRPFDKPLTTSETPRPRSPISRPSSLTSMQHMLPPPRRLPFQHSPKKRHDLDANPQHEIGPSGQTNSAVTTADPDQRPILSPVLQNPISTPFMERRLATPQDTGVHRQGAMHTFNMGEAGPKSAALSPNSELVPTKPRRSRKRAAASGESMPKNKPETIEQPLRGKASNAPHEDDNLPCGQSSTRPIRTTTKFDGSFQTAYANIPPDPAMGQPEEVEPVARNVKSEEVLFERPKSNNRQSGLESKVTEHGPVPDGMNDSWKASSRLRPRKNDARASRVSQRQTLADGAILNTRGIAAKGIGPVRGSCLHTPDGIGLSGTRSASRSGPQRDTNSQNVDVSSDLQNHEHGCGPQATMNKENTVNVSDALLPCNDQGSQTVADAVEADEPTAVHLEKHDVATQTTSMTKDAMTSCCIGKPGTHATSQSDMPASHSDLQAIEDATARRDSAYDGDTLIVGLQLIDEARALVHEHLDGDLDCLMLGSEVDMRESTATMLQSVERLAQETLDKHGTGILNLHFGRMMDEQMNKIKSMLLNWFF